MTYQRQTNRQRKDAMEIRGIVPNVERKDALQKLQEKVATWNLKRLGREMRKLARTLQSLRKTAYAWANHTGCDASECPETASAITFTGLCIGCLAEEFKRRRIKV